MSALGIGLFGLQNLDERAHVSYAFHILDHGVPVDFDGMKLLDPATLTFGAEPNYTVHPPWYYAAMAATVAPFDLSPVARIRVMRCVNAVIAAGAVFLLLAWAARLEMGRTGFAVFATAILLNPYLPFMAGTVTNDNLALLGGALCVVGADEMLAGGGVGRMGTGLVLAIMAKLTAGLLCALLALGAVLYARAWRPDRAKAAVVLCCLIAAAPYFWYVALYGSPVPHDIGQATLIDGEYHGRAFSFANFAGAFFSDISHMWSHQTVVLPGGVWLVAMLFALVLTGIALDRSPLLVAGAAAAIVTLLIHLLVNYHWHVVHRQMPYAFPRYYFPLLGVMALSLARLVQTYRSLAAPAIGLFVVLHPLTGLFFA